MCLPKQAGIHAVHRQEGAGRRPRPPQHLIVEQPQIVPEPDDRHSRAIPPRIRGGVPSEGLLRRDGDLAATQPRDRPFPRGRTGRSSNGRGSRREAHEDGGHWQSVAGGSLPDSEAGIGGEGEDRRRFDERWHCRRDEGRP